MTFATHASGLFVFVFETPARRMARGLCSAGAAGLGLAALLFSGGCAAESPGSNSRLEARIVDEASGQPVAARVALTDEHGKFVEIAGPEHPHLDYLGKRWCYVDGAVSAGIPARGATIEIRRGFETRPLVETLKPAGDATTEKTFRLRRWYDRRQHGYVAGDIHAHLPPPAEAGFHMRVEDLDSQVLLHMADSQSNIATNAHFTGKLDSHSTPACQIYVGQEIREWHMGHLTLLGLRELVPGYPDMGGGLEYWRGVPHWDLMRAARETRRQGGTIIWSHFSSLPGAESPVFAALGLLDAIELITWSDPTQLPNHFAPWEQSGMPQAEFPIMRSMDLYYTLLNAGFRLPIAAGTDKFVEDIPLGSNRTYARLAEPAKAGFDDWLAAIRAGRTFATNGPILEFDFDGHGAGDVVAFTGQCKVKVRAKARSILPFAMLEIVMNGRPVAHKVDYWLEPVDGLYTMDVEATVTLEESAWLAARVCEHPDIRRRILPRGLSVFAHSSPAYFLKDGRSVREQASIDYLRKYVRGLQHWLGTKPDFVREDDRAAATQAAEQALAFYDRL